MSEGTWRDRLLRTIEKKGMSLREVSLSAKLGPNYVQSILTGGKDPSISRFIKVCDVLSVSLPEILYGVDVTAEQMEFLRLLHAAPEDMRDIALQLLRRKADETQS
jgi:ribonucleoside-diphosphate reductase alpha chain